MFGIVESASQKLRTAQQRRAGAILAFVALDVVLRLGEKPFEFEVLAAAAERLCAA